MYSRSLSTLITVACAAFSIAAPLVPRQDTGALGGGALAGLLSELGSTQGGSVPGLSGVGRRGATDALSALGGGVPQLTGEDSPLSALQSSEARDVQHPTLPEIFIGLTDKIAPIAAKIQAAVSVEADIKIDVVVELLTEVFAEIQVAIEYVQYIVDNPTGFVLSVAGTIISIQQLVVIVAVLVKLVLLLLLTVVVAVKGLAAGAVLTLVANIGGLLAVLLGLAVRIVPTLIVVLVPEISAVVSVVYTLKLTSLIVVLGHPAAAGSY